MKSAGEIVPGGGMWSVQARARACASVCMAVQRIGAAPARGTPSVAPRTHDEPPRGVHERCRDSVP